MTTSLLIKKNIQQLFPAYFALVMATGIVSVAAHLLHYDLISEVLFWINVIAFVILFSLYAIRLLFYFPKIVSDLSSHAKGSGFLTIVAGANILGVQFLQLKQNVSVALILWKFSIIIWLVVIYSFFILISIKGNKPSPEEGISGAWLLTVVSSQSIAILGTQLAPYLFPNQAMTFFMMLSFYLLGFLLYFILISIIIYRLTFFKLKAEEFTPTYWIDMGAAAISCLAGATLTKALGGAPPFQSFVPIINVITLLSWASATWWLPIVFILEIWRHKQIPLTYKASYWSMVFPLGMYAAATWKLADTLQLSFLQPTAHIFLFIALFAWIITMGGMLWNLLRSFTQSRNVAGGEG